MKILKLTAVVVIGMSPMLSGCAEPMVMSVPIGSGATVSGAAPYAEYSVANSVVKIVISETPADTSTTTNNNSQGGGTGGGTGGTTPPKKGTGASTALSPAGYTLAAFTTVAAATGTTTAPTTPATKPKAKVKPQTQPQPGSDTTATGCDTDLKGYNTARASVIRAQTDEVTLMAELQAIYDDAKPSGQLSDDQKKTAVSKLKEYFAKSHDANVKIVSDAVGPSGTDGKWSSRVPDLRELCPLKLTANITLDEEPDVNRTYRLYFSHHDFANDTFTVLQTNGMLTSVSASADDQTGAIAVAGAKTLGEVAFLVAPQATLSLAVGAAVKSALAGGKVSYSISRLNKNSIDLDKEKDPAQAFQELSGIIEELAEYRNARNSIPNLSPSLPLEVNLHMENLKADQDAANTELLGLELAVSMKCNDFIRDNNDPSKNKLNEGKNDPDGTDGMTKKSGVFVSVMRPCIAELDRISDVQGRSVLKRVGFMAQDARRVTSLPFDRGLFVVDKTTYEFTDGRLTKADISRPSEVLGGVSLPLQIIGAFFSSISDGVKGKSAVIDAETARLNSQANLLNAKAALIQAQPAKTIPSQ